MWPRIGITLIGIAAYRLVSHLPLPGIDQTVLLEFFSGSPSGLLAAGGFTRASVLSLGIHPYLTATVIVLLLSGIMPRLRRLRDGGPELRPRMDRLIYALTAVICLAQAWSEVLEGIRGPVTGQPLVPGSGLGFRLPALFTITAATMGLAWVMELMTRRGVGNGVALIIFADIASGLGPAIRHLVAGPGCRWRGHRTTAHRGRAFRAHSAGYGAAAHERRLDGRS